MSLINDIDKILHKVEKPGRYIGGELHSLRVKLADEQNTRFVFAFPDTYEIGMSYMGLQIIYSLLNNTPGVMCERVFAPALDMEEQMTGANIPLYSLETKEPVHTADFLGFTLQYELSFSNILNMLALASIPLKASDRGKQMPFVTAGGPCSFNPEPLADFVDFFLIGDGEEVLPLIMEKHALWKKSDKEKVDFLHDISTIDGIYVPSFYDVEYDKENEQIKNMSYIGPVGCDVPDAPTYPQINKAFIADLNTAHYPENPIVPLIDIVHDRAVVEIFRGCTRGCRFCQAGMIYRPIRERDPKTIKNIAKSQLESTGYEEMSILSLSTSDYSQIEPLVTDLMGICKSKDVALSLPSLRLDSFSFKALSEIQGYKKSGLTFAPEAGSQRLRDVINKSITDEHIYSATRQAISLGWTNIKLYFMVGLPTETYEDLEGICEIANKITEIYYEIQGRKGGRFNVTVSVSNFVPKAHTPFQWYGQNDTETFHEKHMYLKDRLRGKKNITFNYHDNKTSYVEAVFARGDRRLGEVLIKAHELGCKFDGWGEHFNYDKWVEAFEITGVDPSFYAHRTRTYDEILPWDFINTYVEKEFLIIENKKAADQLQTMDCRHGCMNCGVNKKFDCKLL